MAHGQLGYRLTAPHLWSVRPVRRVLTRTEKYPLLLWYAKNYHSDSFESKVKTSTDIMRLWSMVDLKLSSCA